MCTDSPVASCCTVKLCNRDHLAFAVFEEVLPPWPLRGHMNRRADLVRELGRVDLMRELGRADLVRDLGSCGSGRTRAVRRVPSTSATLASRWPASPWRCSAASTAPHRGTGRSRTSRSRASRRSPPASWSCPWQAKTATHAVRRCRPRRGCRPGRGPRARAIAAELASVVLLIELDHQLGAIAAMAEIASVVLPVEFELCDQHRERWPCCGRHQRAADRRGRTRYTRRGDRYARRADRSLVARCARGATVVINDAESAPTWSRAQPLAPPPRLGLRWLGAIAAAVRAPGRARVRARGQHRDRGWNLRS